jgi:hypothetical protein
MQKLEPVLSREKLLESVGKLNRVANYLEDKKYAQLAKPVEIRGIIIASSSKDDKEKAPPQSLV